MPFRRYSGAAGGGETGPSGQGDVRHDMAWHCRRPAAGGLPGSPGGDKRGRDTKVSLPLLTPQPFPRTRLPPVARLKARGPQGRLLLQEYTLDGSGAFRSDGACALHRLAAHCYARRFTQSKFRAIKRPISSPTHGTEPPFLPFSRECFAERPAEGQRGVKRGHRKPQVSYVPFCLRRQAAAMPGLPIGSHSRLQRQAAVSAERPTVSRRLKKASPAAAGRRNGGTVHPPAPVRELKAGAPGGACQRLIKVKA